MEYELGQIIEFTDIYPDGLYDFVIEHDYTLEELEPTENFRRVQIVEIPKHEETPEERREEFLKEFFNTSLGYIRRSVTMADGSHKDFLSDLLPVISMGVQGGQSVNIIAYNMPDFTEPITDWTIYQHIETVTPQFIQECFLQLSNDFMPTGG